MDEAVTSPELILVSPPEVAAAARRALPDPALWVPLTVPRAPEPQSSGPAAVITPVPRPPARAPEPPPVISPRRLPVPVPPPASVAVAPVPPAPPPETTRRGARFSRGSVAFTTLLALNCLAPFLLLVAARH